MKQLNKYITFLGLYVAQSVPMSFFTTVIPVIMRQEAYSLESIGMLQFVKLPWLLKFLWAPLIDKKTNTLGQFKKVIISSELFYAAIILSIGFFELQTDFTLIVVLVVLAIFASATQDIATDALALLTLKKEQRPLGNSVQSAGGFLGALVGGGVLLLIYNKFGWQALLIGLAAFVLVALIPLLSFKYKPAPKPRIEKISLKSLSGFFGQKNVKRHLIFIFFAYTGLSGIMTMVKPYMVDNGFNLGQIGFLSGILGTTSAAVAALFAGRYIRRKGMWLAASTSAFFVIAVGSYFSQLDWIQFETVHIGIGLCMMWAVYGMLNVCIFTMAMDWARPGYEGTDFTIQIIISQLGALLVAGLSGFITSEINYLGLFIVEVIFAFFTFFYAVFYYPYRNENGEFIRPEDR